MKKLITTIANFIIDVGTVIKFMSIAATCAVVYISMGSVLSKLRVSPDIAYGVPFGVSAILFIYMCIKFISSQYELSMLRDRVEALKAISGNTENMKNTIPGTAEASSRAKYFMGFAGSTINYTRDAFNLFGIIVISLLIGLFAAGLVGDLQSSHCEYSTYGCVNLPIVSFVVFIVVLVVWVSKFALSKYMYYLRQEEHDCLISIAFNLEIISGKIRNIQFIQKPIPPGQKYIKEFDKKIQFGKYPFYEDGSEKEIDWIILDIDADNNALVISDYALDNVKYNEESEDITWENSTIRKWLNNDFLNKAFSPEQRSKIINSYVANNDNAEYGTRGGNVTKDKLFLLSIDEAEKYFKNNSERIAYPTPYAKSKKSVNGNLYVSDGYVSTDRGGSCWWWLRSPGNSQDRAALVITDGDVHSHGGPVNYDSYVVRVAFKIKLNNL